MHRMLLIEMLERYQPLNVETLDNISRVKQFVSENENCFERDCSQGHITGSAWIIDFSKSYALLTYHKKLSKWLQLGGHADGDSDVYAVALREAQEESGLIYISPLSKEIFDIDIHLVPDKVGSHFHYDVRFLFQADRTEKLIVSHESKELAWISLFQLDNFTKEISVLRMREKTNSWNRILYIH